MTATILLVRHAAHSELGRVLSGRAGDAALSSAGREQAARLADRLRRERVDLVQTSPIRRAQETAQAIAARTALTVEQAEPLTEIDFGAWSGKPFCELESDPHWHAWNARRSVATPPEGEAMAAVQDRVLAHMRRAARNAAGRVVAMISHADVIRAAVAGVLGLSLDRTLSFDVDPASVTRVVAGDWGERIITLNERGF